MKSLKLIALAAVAICALSACSGSAAAPTAAASVPNGGSSAGPSSGAVASTTGGQAPTPTAQGPAGGSVDLCGLISPTDLKTVTGSDYGAGVLDSVGECTWRVGGATVNDGKGQIVAAVQATTIDFIKSSFGSGGSDVTVSGHTGFWNPTSGLQSIWVDIGGGNLLVLSLDPIVDNSQSTAQKLAEIAVSKM